MAKILATGALRAREQDRVDAESWRQLKAAMDQLIFEINHAVCRFNEYTLRVAQAKGPKVRTRKKRLTSAEK